MAYQTGTGAYNPDDAILQPTRKSQTTNLSNVDITKLPPAAQARLLEAQTAQAQAAAAVVAYPSVGTRLEDLGFTYLPGRDATTASMRYVKIADGKGGYTEVLEDNPGYKTSAEIAKASGAYDVKLAANRKLMGSSVTPSSKKIIGYFQWTQPTTGGVYNVPKYEDGTDGLSEWTGGLEVPNSFNLQVPGFDTAGSGTGTGLVTIVPGPTGVTTQGGPTLAKNTFKNTLALFFGAAEIAKPWADELYNLVNPYYTSGSSVTEALNMAIQEGRNNPNLKEFTSRFSGIYALQDKLNSGVAVTVPTIAEYTASEAKMGDVLNQAGLSSLNKQSFLGDLLGKGVNVAEFTNRINSVFLRIDQLPDQAKSTVNRYFPTLDRTQLAQALLTGESGAVELSKQLSGMEVLAAAEQQGLGAYQGAGNPLLAGGLGLEEAKNLAASGYDYQSALKGFGEVKQLNRANQLANLTGGQFTQQQAQSAVFGKSADELERLRLISEQEKARLSGSAGTSRGSFSTGYLNKQSSSGQF